MFSVFLPNSFKVMIYKTAFKNNFQNVWKFCSNFIFIEKYVKTKGNNPFGLFPFIFIFPFDCFALRERFTALRSLSSEAYRRGTFYLLCLIFACAAAKRAIGTRYGEQLT